MLKKLLLLIPALLLILPALSFAGDVYVDGYTRDDGTYVRPHVRSSPDNSIANNYGPSQSSDELMNPRSRDYDNDGTPNYMDRDSDNDFIHDDRDSNPYGNSQDGYGNDAFGNSGGGTSTFSDGLYD